MTLARFSRGEFIDRILGYSESMGGLINALSVCVCDAQEIIRCLLLGLPSSVGTQRK